MKPINKIKGKNTWPNMFEILFQNNYFFTKQNSFV